jgi:hypothetical protein
MGLLGNSKWGPGGANDNIDDAESSTPPPNAPNAPRLQKSNKEDRAPRWKKGKEARNERSAVDEQPGIMGNGIDYGYGNLANLQRQGGSTQHQSPAERMTRDGPSLNTPRFDNNGQHGYGHPQGPHGSYDDSIHSLDSQHLDTNTHHSYSPPQNTQRLNDTNSSAQPPQLISPYERMARDALPQNTNPHHNNTVAPNSHNTLPTSSSRQDMVAQPPQRNSASTQPPSKTEKQLPHNPHSPRPQSSNPPSPPHLPKPLNPLLNILL